MQIEPRGYFMSFLEIFAVNFFAAGVFQIYSREKREDKKELIELNSVENAERFFAGTWSGIKKTLQGALLYKYDIYPDGTFDRFFVHYGETSWGNVKSLGSWHIETEKNVKTGEMYYLAVMSWKENDCAEVAVKAILDNKFGESLFMLDTFGKYAFTVNRSDLLQSK